MFIFANSIFSSICFSKNVSVIRNFHLLIPNLLYVFDVAWFNVWKNTFCQPLGVGVFLFPRIKNILACIYFCDWKVQKYFVGILFREIDKKTKFTKKIAAKIRTLKVNYMARVKIWWFSIKARFSNQSLISCSFDVKLKSFICWW